ncbi:hypothetical protein C7M52_03440 [Mixta theicola]|nr:hypothetical protein [Mixta theicola]QHM77441.1 hypothetical protein C7M52_03440 [Mixta theicola]
MRKKLKLLVVACLAVVAGTLLFSAWTYIKMEFASSAYYSQQDKREYAFYTPELIKNMPRITDHYRFEYGNISGPEAQVFTIRFDGTTDTSKIRRYLMSVGYQPQAQCNVKAECWLSQSNTDIVTLFSYSSPDSVVLQIYRSPYTE